MPANMATSRVLERSKPTPGDHILDRAKKNAAVIETAAARVTG
jgi:hypothetical protein